MVRRYYIDTNIWLDLYQDRKGYLGEELGTFAFALFVRIRREKAIIVLSDFLLEELSHVVATTMINGLLLPFKERCTRVTITSGQLREAKQLALRRDVPRGDALHAVVARDERAILITRDNHFKQLLDVVTSYKPEEIT